MQRLLNDLLEGLAILGLLAMAGAYFGLIIFDIAVGHSSW